MRERVFNIIILDFTLAIINIKNTVTVYVPVIARLTHQLSGGDNELSDGRQNIAECFLFTSVHCLSDCVNS